jgi:carbon starvation protein
MILLANILWETESGRVVLHAMPLLLVVLGCLVLAYRYYSAFLAARVMALDDSRTTPAYQFNDGQNYHPTNRWVLFGHHFAAISGAGPLIGPVLAIQYGYMPGLIWLVAGVCLAGAVQDMLTLAASVRRGGKSLAEIARTELGNQASLIVTLAILFIVIIALAGLGIVVVKALGGEQVALPDGLHLRLPAGEKVEEIPGQPGHYHVPAGARVYYPNQQLPVVRSESFHILAAPGENSDLKTLLGKGEGGDWQLVGKWYQVVPGSSWERLRSPARSPSPSWLDSTCTGSAKGALSRRPSSVQSGCWPPQLPAAGFPVPRSSPISRWARGPQSSPWPAMASSLRCFRSGCCSARATISRAF